MFYLKPRFFKYWYIYLIMTSHHPSSFRFVRAHVETQPRWSHPRGFILPNGKSQGGGNLKWKCGWWTFWVPPPKRISWKLVNGLQRNKPFWYQRGWAANIQNSALIFNWCVFSIPCAFDTKAGKLSDFFTSIVVSQRCGQFRVFISAGIWNMKKYTSCRNKRVHYLRDKVKGTAFIVTNRTWKLVGLMSVLVRFHLPHMTRTLWTSIPSRNGRPWQKMVISWNLYSWMPSYVFFGGWDQVWNFKVIIQLMNFFKFHAHFPSFLRFEKTLWWWGEALSSRFRDATAVLLGEGSATSWPDKNRGGERGSCEVQLGDPQIFVKVMALKERFLRS